VPLSKLLPEIVAAVGVPVIAAGGVATRAQVVSALAAGASAARVGTRFVATRESGAHERYVSKLVSARAADTELTECFHVGWPDAPHRVLRSSIAAARATNAQIVGEAEIAGQRVPIPRFGVFPPTTSTTGEIEAMALYAGESVDAVHEVQGAAEIVAELAGSG
jgi:NAD(P)H-dependent flavin oxidoreductase YrpB (nitropropane dioxygenase family)